MATTTLRPTRTIKRKFERRTKGNSVLSFLKNLFSAPGIEKKGIRTKELNATKERMAIMSNSLRVNWR